MDGTRLLSLNVIRRSEGKHEVDVSVDSAPPRRPVGRISCVSSRGHNQPGLDDHVRRAARRLVQPRGRIMEQMYFGAAVLYVGGRIAPRQKRFAVLALSGLLLLFVGFSTALVLTQPSSVSLPESISSTAGVIFAVGAVVVALQRGELDLGEDAV